MYSKRVVEAVRWIIAANALAGIVILYTYAFRNANPTTVALTLLFLVLVLAGYWGLRYAVVASIAATGLFNYYFLPPLHTFTISDTQNWVALFAFLLTAIFASHLSSRIREETTEANDRRRESEMLYRLGRQLLQPESVAELLNFIPSSVANAFDSPAVTLYVAARDRIYLSAANTPGAPSNSGAPSPTRSLTAWQGGVSDEVRPLSTAASARDTLILQLREAMLNPIMRPAHEGELTTIPLHVGVRPTGALQLECPPLSRETMEALSGLVSMSIERAEALENSARSEVARENERLRTALLDSVTHELRTPLTAIKASITSLLSQQNLDPDSRTDLLTVIDEESDRLNHLIQQSVEMAQLDDNKVKLELRSQPIAPLIDAAVHECLAAHPGRDIRVTVSSTLPNVLADPAWIHKVLINLLENAVKYSATRDSEPAQPIFIAADRPSADSNSVAITVADRGAGIDPLEQEMIFDKFYRGQSLRNDAHHQRIPGTGMGLAISRAIVNAHGGPITVTSQVGHGSVFTFTLPIARP